VLKADVLELRAFHPCDQVANDLRQPRTFGASASATITARLYPVVAA
jgi:hypothetical protein